MTPDKIKNQICSIVNIELMSVKEKLKYYRKLDSFYSKESDINKNIEFIERCLKQLKDLDNSM